VSRTGELDSASNLIADARPEEEDLESQEPQPASCELGPSPSRSQPLPTLSSGEASARGVPQLRVLQGAAGDRRRLSRKWYLERAHFPSPSTRWAGTGHLAR
jgi:hypothetical protein